MASGAELAMILRAKDEASGVFDKVKGSAGGLTSGIGSMVTGLAGVGLAVGGLGMLASGIASAATSMISGNAQMETYETQLGTMMGSVDAAKDRIKQLAQIGAETPFELTQLVAAEKIMMGFGLTSEKTMKLTGKNLDEYRTSMGDMAAGTGVDLSEITNLWAKFGSGATGESLARLQELGIVTKEQLAEVGIQFSKSGELLSPLPEAMAAAMKIADAKFGGGMKALSSTFDGQMSTLADNFNQAKTLLMQPIFEVLKTGLTSVNELLSSPAFQAGLTSFAEAGAVAITSLIEGFGMAYAAIEPFAMQIAAVLVPAFAAVQAALPGIMAGLAGLFGLFSGDGSWTGLVDAAAMLSQAFGPATTAMILDFVGLAGDAFRAFAGFVTEQFGVVVSWVQENWPLIQQTIQTVMTAITDFWETHGHRIIEIVQSAWTIVSTTIGGALDIILSLLKAGMQIINGDWSGAWETIVGLVERTFERLGTIISAAFDSWYALIDIATGGMLTDIENWMTDTSTAITSGMDAISMAISDGWEAAKSSVASILPTILSAIMTVWNQIPEDIRTDLVLIATHIVTAGATWVTNLTTAGASMLTAISTALTNMVTAATTWATSTFIAPVLGLALTAGAAMTSAGSSMMTAITGKLAEIVGAVTTWADSTFLAPLRGLIESARSTAASIGQAIVDGVTNAISAGAGAIRQAIESAVRGALNAAKAALGIESPSRVFRQEVGLPIVQGLAMGILDNAPMVADAAMAMAEAARQQAMAALRGGNPLGLGAAVNALGGTIGQGLTPPIRQFAPLAGGSIIPGLNNTPSGSVPIGPGTVKVQVSIGQKPIDDMWVTTRERVDRQGR